MVARLTDADVESLACDVLAVPVDAAAERQWAQESAAVFAKTEQRLMAEFKLWRFLRDDARMTAAAAELAQTRQCLTYLRGLL